MKKRIIIFFQELIEDFRARPFYLCALALLGLLIGWFVSYLFFLYPVKDGGQLASWVQAIGSILAIFFAVIIGKKQTETALKTIKISNLSEEYELQKKEVNKIYNEMLFLWRAYSIPKEVFEKLKENNYIEFTETEKIELQGNREILKINDSKINNKIEFRRLINHIFMQKQSKLLFLDIYNSFNNIDLRSFPYAIIADQLITAKISSTGFINKYKHKSNIKQSEVTEVEKDFIELMNQIHRCALAISEVIKKMNDDFQKTKNELIEIRGW
ncbi:MAG: hypothetical protein ACTJHW_10430 [Paenalcaligenes sp.]